jgi:DNA-binding CsgD family transcriptional regulator
MALAEPVLELIRVIHAAGVEPRRWLDALLAMGRHFDARAGIVLTSATNSDELTFNAEFGSDPEWQALFNQEYCRPDVNPLLPEFRKGRPGTVAADWMLVPKRDLLRSRFYNEWCEPQGYHGFVGVITALDTRAVGGLMLTRDRKPGDFRREEIALLELLAPHLVQATAASRSIGALQGRLRLCEALLDVAADPVVVVNRDARLVSSNARAAALLARCDGMQLRGGKLVANRHDVTTVLHRRVRAATQMTPPTAGTLAAPRSPEACPYAVLVAPIPVEATGGLPAEPLAAVLIADPGAASPDAAGMLRSIYGLTEAEAKLVALLALETPPLAQAAEQLGVTLETVKTHLKHACSKMGVRRQSEVVRLALRTAAALRPP